jgi:hypothetical protein
MCINEEFQVTERGDLDSGGDREEGGQRLSAHNRCIVGRTTHTLSRSDRMPLVLDERAST